ncbi:MAG: alpha/beta hydrolase, partial [Verrucomicrobiales bacterium]
AWNSILPEYDPYKYGSFAVNAGHQVYRLTTEIQQRLAHPSTREQLDQFPPILAFQSVDDAPVSAPTLIQGLFQKLPEAGHELVLFDINRMAGIDSLMVSDPTSKIASILKAPSRSFTVSLVTNQSAQTPEVECRRWQANNSKMKKDRLDLSWPEDVYSLSHISLPFAVSDPLYGSGEVSDGEVGYNLGNVALRGERGVLRISPADQLRLRWNPFYPYLEGRALRFIRERSSAAR